MADDRPNAVFLVHGRNTEAESALRTTLHALGLEVWCWEDGVRATGKGAPHAREVLDAVMRRVRAVVILASGDDEGRLLPHLCASDELDTEGTCQPQPRQNVVFEAGLAFGLFPDRTVIVKIGRLRLPSDLDGVQHVPLDASLESRRALASRLRTAGCHVLVDSRTSDPAPEDPELPPVHHPKTAEVASMGVFRRLRSLFAVPKLGGDLEVVRRARIGERIILAARVPAATEVSGFLHWLPGSPSPRQLSLDEATRSANAVELRLHMVGPPGVHYFDLVGKPAGGDGGEIWARALCVVEEP